MAQKSYLDEIGQVRRNEYELPRNDYNKNKDYVSSEDWKSTPTSGDHPERGKGTNGSNFTPYRPHEKTGTVVQVDTINGGNSYDVLGKSDVDGGYNGRNYLTGLNLYNENNQYTKEGIEVDTLIDGQFFVS